MITALLIEVPAWLALIWLLTTAVLAAAAALWVGLRVSRELAVRRRLSDYRSAAAPVLRSGSLQRPTGPLPYEPLPRVRWRLKR